MRITTTLFTALAGVWLFAAAAPAVAHDHGRGWGERRYEDYDRGWHHGHHKHYHRHERDFVVYQPYYAPPPVVYQPAPVYYGYREPALTIGISPIVIPLR